MSNSFGNALREARLKADLTLQQLGDAVGRTRACISAIELGRIGVEQSPDLVSRLEVVLQLPPGALAKHLPADHPARRMAQAAIQVVGYLVTDGEPPPLVTLRETIRVADHFLGCYMLQVIGNGLEKHHLLDGDYVVYRPLGEHESPSADAMLLVRTNKRRQHLLARQRATPRGRQYVPLAGGEPLTDQQATLVGQVVGVVRLS